MDDCEEIIILSDDEACNVKESSFDELLHELNEDLPVRELSTRKSLSVIDVCSKSPSQEVFDSVPDTIPLEIDQLSDVDGKSEVPASILERPECNEVLPEKESTEESRPNAQPPSGGKRKRRTREEIEQEKLIKEVNRVRREMNAAKNSKCEQYLFCYVNLSILALEDQIKSELSLRFTERSISEQIIFNDETPMRVLWKRKRIDAFLEDGKLHTNVSMDTEGVYLAVLDADSFTAMVKEKRILAFLEEQLANYKISDPQLTVVVLGKCSMRDSTVNEVLFEAFERFRVQFRFPKSAGEFSFLVAQLHRAIAKNEKKSEYDSRELPVIAMQKGIREGPHLVRDWWSRMLDHVHRMTEDQKRALIDRYPSPMDLMAAVLAAENAGDAMFQLASIKVTRNKCLGPVIAQKLYTILTSWDGSEIIHSP